MTDDNASQPVSAPRRAGRLTPRAGVRPQLVSAALMWSIGAAILLIRGVGYLQGRYWHAWVLALAVVLGVAKSRLLLDRVARKGVARIHERGRACYFGFFSWKSWLFVATMMGGGILLRHSGLRPGILAVIYIGVGTALLLADRIFWAAAAASFRTPAVVPAPAPAE